MWKPTKSEKEIRFLYDYFLRTYGDSYPNYVLEYIEEYFFDGIGKYQIPDILHQIYHFLDIVPTMESYYHAYLNKLMSAYDINRNILEVGCGALPSFTELLSNKQIKGTITAYDPNLISTTLNKNITFVKREFTYYDDVSKYDLLVGIMPCDATELIIEKAIENNKDFFVAMCGCSHGVNYGFPMYRMNPEEYRYMVIEQTKRWLKEYGNGSLSVDYLDDEFEIPYPILYKK